VPVLLVYALSLSLKPLKKAVNITVRGPALTAIPTAPAAATPAADATNKCWVSQKVKKNL
jgi:hypothetical protein